MGYVTPIYLILQVGSKPFTTPPKFDGSPLKNGWLEDFLVSLWVSAYFQGRLLLNFGRVTIDPNFQRDISASKSLLPRSLVQGLHVLPRDQRNQDVQEHRAALKLGFPGRINRSTFFGRQTPKKTEEEPSDESPRKLQHTDIAHSRQSSLANYERNPFIACW